MGRRHLLGCSLATLWMATPALATQPTADAEIARLEAQLSQARARAALARELEAARREAESASARLAAAEAASLQLAASQAPPDPPAPPAEPPATEPSADDPRADTSEPPPKDRQQFGGIEFGVGISFTLDVGSSDRVREASIVNGIVRVDDQDNGVARIMLESHYFFTPNRPGPFGIAEGGWGHGPFVALQPGTDDIIQAIAAGWMVGFRRPIAQGGEDTGQSFNFGLGFVVDPNTRILGDGIVANEPLPAGETEIRFTEEMQTGVLFLFSFSF